MRSAASGWAWVRAAAAMAARRSGAGEQAGEGGQQLAGNVQVCLVEQHSRAGLDHLLGVAALVVVGGGGKGNQQGGLAGGGQFGHRGCAAAGHDQRGLGKAGGHIVEEWADLPAAWVGAAGGVGGLGRLQSGARRSGGER